MKHLLALLTVSVCFTGAISAATFTVTHTADTGPGSLRQTLTDAAASAGKDTIQFTLAGSGPHTIQVASVLPDLAGDILDGTAVAGGVSLEYALPQGAVVLTVSESAGEIKGVNFRSVVADAGIGGYQTGLRLSWGGGHRVSACQFTGRQLALQIDSPGNHVGGGTGARNRFASLRDIDIYGTSLTPNTGNVVKGNEFVASTAGVGPYSYPLIGITISHWSSGVVIESDEASGAVNTFDGLAGVLHATSSPGLVFRGNRLGDSAANADVVDSFAACLSLNSCTDAIIENNSFRRTGATSIRLSACPGARVTGNVMRNTAADQFAFPNSRLGISVLGSGALNTDISNNVIAGLDAGIYFQSAVGDPAAPYSGVRIHGNTIGLTEAYFSPVEMPVILMPGLLAPVHSGIIIEGPARDFEIGGIAFPPGGQFGPNTILATNAIYARRHPSGAGAFPENLNFRYNRIAAAAWNPAVGHHLVPRQAIVLNPDLPPWIQSSYTVPANDPMDGDAGSNKMQNFPVVTGISEGGIVTGTLHSAPSSEFTIQCYFALSSGAELLSVPVFGGSAPVTTGADGNASFSISLMAPALQGASVWLTATDSAGNTSHFSEFAPASLPVISITPPDPAVLAQEGMPFSLTLTRQGSLSFSTTVNLSVPYAGTDLTVPASVTFLPGESTKQVPVTVIDDNLFENREEFFLQLDTIQGGVAGDAAAYFTVASSDPLTVTIGSVTVEEGSSLQMVDVPVRLNVPGYDPLNPPYAGTFLVRLKFAGGTATENVEYYWPPPGNWVLFGSTTFDKTITIYVNGDDVHEPDETIVIDVLSSSNTWPDGSPKLAATGHTPGTLTLTNDDPLKASIAAASQQVTEGGAGDNVSTAFTIQLNAAPLQEVRVQWQTVANTAEPGSDFTAASGEAVFAPGETDKVIDVAIAGDDLVDRWPDVPESFHVDLTGATGAVLTTGGERATITILDDDSRQITVADASITEGDSGTAMLTFTASIPAATGSPVSFSWSTADDTATGADYMAVSGTATIPAGEVSTTLGIEVKGDTLYEIDESLAVLLTNSMNGPLTTARVTGTIVNNDAAPALTLDDTVVTVGPDDVDFSAWFRVRTSAISGAPVQVQWNTQAGTAAPGLDYTESNGTVIIPAGERTRWIAVPVHGDNESEPDETFTLRITAAGGASLPGGGLSATATLKEVAISEFFPVPGVSNLYVIRFPTGKGQAYLVEQAYSLDDEFGWVGVYSIQGSGTILTHTQYSDSPHTFFRVRVVSSPPPN